MCVKEEAVMSLTGMAMEPGVSACGRQRKWERQRPTVAGMVVSSPGAILLCLFNGAGTGMKPDGSPDPEWGIRSAGAQLRSHRVPAE